MSGRTLIESFFVALLGLGLAACGGDGSGGSTVSAPPLVIQWYRRFGYCIDRYGVGL